MTPDEATRALAFAAAVKNLHATLLEGATYGSTPKQRAARLSEVTEKLAVLCVDAVVDNTQASRTMIPVTDVLDAIGLDWHQARAIAQAAKDDSRG